MKQCCLLFGLVTLTMALGCHRPNPSSTVSAPAAARSAPMSPQLAEAIDRIIDQQRAIIALSIGTQLKRVQGNATNEETQKLTDQIVALLWSGVDRAHVGSALIQIYRQQFSAAQLSDIAAFYATPSGQAVLAKAPVIQAQFSAVMMGQLQANNPRAVDLMNQFAQAHLSSKRAK